VRPGADPLRAADRRVAVHPAAAEQRRRRLRGGDLAVAPGVAVPGERAQPLRDAGGVVDPAPLPGGRPRPPLRLRPAAARGPATAARFAAAQARARAVLDGTAEEADPPFA